MPIVQPPKERHTFEDTGSAIKVIIPHRANFPGLIVSGLWFMGWACMEIILVVLCFNLLATGQFGATGLLGGGLALLAWLGIWTVVGGISIYAIWQELAGKEHIEVSHDSIKIQQPPIAFGRTQEYSASRIKELRVTPSIMHDHMRSMAKGLAQPRGFLRTMFAFDYGSRTVRFGAGAGEAEANQILEKIVARFPQYRADNREIG